MSEWYIDRSSAESAVDYFEDIDQLYAFPENRERLWKVVSKIHRLDRLRTTVMKVIRWDICKDFCFDKRRMVYVCVSFLINLK